MRENAAEKLKEGMVGVIPTDTVYGIVASARIPEAVERVYALRNRDGDKPCIILLAERKDLGEFGVTPGDESVDFLNKHWPGAVSVLFPCEDDRFFFLHRGIQALAFRVPDNEWLRNVLRKTGPLIAPSANSQGKPAAKSIDEARQYFHSKVDFYIDGGSLEGEPSTLVQFEGNQVNILRSGRVKL
ncbi:MAG: threonylcarbamoyl-AMP synthase [Candidatus Moranbacteria bacterium]|jgi:L-threonylcarbamoyladenylate synthase|nr:threonylcarbamoyl-AMP synthase [Candidatus Moranbacteria bacterium]MBP9801773.1 threonylcarbamoyl-AMP synthase [Candidatus Moranbacteria bacterium]